eukprot:3342931-Amphidinium_carterae.2
MAWLTETKRSLCNLACLGLIWRGNRLVAGERRDEPMYRHNFCLRASSSHANALYAGQKVLLRML